MVGHDRIRDNVIPEEREIFVRGWVVSPRLRRNRDRDRLRDLGPSEWSVVFDCETTTDSSQRLRVGSYHVRHDGRLWETGYFYDPDALTASEILTLRNHALGAGAKVMTRLEFVDTVLLHYGWELSGLVIGFNLRFDFSRIATRHTKSRTRLTSMRGAFSFTVTDDPTKPTIQVQPAGAKSAFYRFAAPARRSAEQRNRDAGGDVATSPGYFVDVATLAKALTSKAWRLGDLAAELDTDTRKLAVDDFGAAITPQFLDYAMTDCQVTWECFEALQNRYRGYGLTKTPLHQVFSEASIGKAHLRQMGLQGWRHTDQAFPDWLIAVTLETYYGGRTETRIRRTATPGVLVDFASQYPTSYALQDMWRYQIAATVRWEDEDAASVQSLIDSIDLDEVLEPEMWGDELDRLVLVEPTGNLLVTRAAFGADLTRNVAVANRIGGAPQWYTLADVIAAKIEGGTAPRILRSIRLHPGPPQNHLRLIEVAGSGKIIDPYEDDFVSRLVELRRTIGTDWHQGIDQEAAEQLGHLLKITVNAVSYGTAIEQNVNEYANPVQVAIGRTDGTTYKTPPQHRKETPGAWFHPLIATLVAAGGRLLLAAAMRLVHDLGGEYTFCDTDSLFIVATQHGGNIPCAGTPTGTIKALSWEQVPEVTERFNQLNPFDTGGSILEIEDENLDPDDGQQREVWCWSIASKRYALYTLDADGRPVVLGDRRSEHGLGHLLGPPGWITEWWTHLLGIELGFDHPEPGWFDQPAIGRLTVSSHHELAAFKTHNKDRPYTSQVRPFGFLLITQPDPFDTSSGGPRSLVAPYESDPDRRLSQQWLDRGSDDGASWTIRTDRPDEHIDGSILVASYRDYFTSYRAHPESKAAGANGERAGLRTRGLLHPRTIRAKGLSRIGKEANRLSENPELVLDKTDRAIDYPEPPVCEHCGTQLVGRQRQWCSDKCRKRHQREAR